jgi:hypothetical protein
MNGALLFPCFLMGKKQNKETLQHFLFDHNVGYENVNYNHSNLLLSYIYVDIDLAVTLYFIIFLCMIFTR